MDCEVVAFSEQNKPREAVFVLRTVNGEVLFESV